MSFRERFIELRDQIPEQPDISDLTRYRDQIYQEHRRIYDTKYLKLMESPEPKVIIKCPANSFQKSKFKENWVFRFQSLCDGRMSEIIPNKDRSKYNISDTCRVNGGIFPESLQMADNYNEWYDHYRKLSSRIFAKINERLYEYYTKVDSVKNEWWHLYQEYLQSTQWKEKRQERLIMDHKQCQYINCSASTNLHVHHITYENVGNENTQEDLVTLCQPHHSLIHKRPIK